MGTIIRNLPVIAKRETYAVPLTYAFLTSKEKVQYAFVLQAITNAVGEYAIENCKPTKIMDDFEQGIIEACNEIY